MDLGLAGIREEIEAELAALDLAAPDGMKRRQFLRAASIACDGAIRFARRYGELARRMADAETDASRREELSQIAEICARVPAHPPRTFWEGLQAVWFVHLGVMLDDGGVAHALGLHGLQIMPLLGYLLSTRLEPDRGAGRSVAVLFGLAAAYVIVLFGAFAQAMVGIPLVSL